MKLRTINILCPLCGDPASWLGKLSQQDTWIGYTRLAWCNEHRELPFDERTWLVLFDERKVLVGIIPGADGFLMTAGNRVHFYDDNGEIPF